MTVETWSESRGQKPYTVWVGERPDKSLAVYLRWYVANKPRYQKTEVATVRDARGRTLKKSIERAQSEADAKVEELKGLRAPKPRTGPLTLGDGVALAFSLTGCYPLDPAKDKHTRDQQRRAAEFVKLLGGPDVLWEEVTPGQVRGIWRKIGQVATEGGDHNKAEKVVLTLFRIATWLEGEYPAQRFPRPMKGWRAELKDYWRKRGHSAEPKRPRFEEADAAELIDKRHLGDPRLALMLAIGPRLRGGQVLQTMRSDCDLSAAGIGFGTVRIPYTSQRKRAPVLHLHEHERAEIDAAMQSGYLRDLEAAYQRKEIRDYALFPAGKLRKGFAVVERCAEYIERTTLSHMLNDLQERADVNVKREKGRGWHGLRRLFSDLDERAAVSSRAKDEAGGWKPGSDMRQSVYQEQENDEVRAETARLRATVRPTRKDGGQ